MSTLIGVASIVRVSIKNCLSNINWFVESQEGRLLFMPCGYDNAAMESWNPTFKVEAVHGERFLTRAEAKSHVFEYIEVYYLCPLGTIESGFTLNWAMSARKRLKLKKSLSRVSVKAGQDQMTAVTRDGVWEMFREVARRFEETDRKYPRYRS